jgi:hypothetical protein
VSFRSPVWSTGRGSSLMGAGSEGVGYVPDLPGGIAVQVSQQRARGVFWGDQGAGFVGPGEPVVQRRADPGRILAADPREGQAGGREDVDGDRGRSLIRMDVQAGTQRPRHTCVVDQDAHGPGLVACALGNLLPAGPGPRGHPGSPRVSRRTHVRAAPSRRARRETRPTVLPVLARPIATARPMPRPAPVTSAVLPSSEVLMRG